MLANLATALFEHGRIKTTQAKAKRVQPLAERMITFAKRGDLNARRRVLTVVRDKGVVHELFTEIGPRYANRPGGYTRITKLGPRKGDNAPMALIELVEPLSEQAVAEAEAAAKRGAKEREAREKAAAATAAPAVDEVVEGAQGEVDSAGGTDSDEAEDNDGVTPTPSESADSDADTSADPEDGAKVAEGDTDK